jgi:hypothetical protein
LKQKEEGEKMNTKEVGHIFIWGAQKTKFPKN